MIHNAADGNVLIYNQVKRLEGHRRHYLTCVCKTKLSRTVQLNQLGNCGMLYIYVRIANFKTRVVPNENKPYPNFNIVY